MGKDQRRQIRAVLVERRARVIQGFKVCLVLLVLAVFLLLTWARACWAAIFS